MHSPAAWRIPSTSHLCWSFVRWTQADSEVPRGSVGTVVAYSQGGYSRVKFPNSVFDLLDSQVGHAPTG